MSSTPPDSPEPAEHPVVAARRALREAERRAIVEHAKVASMRLGPPPPPTPERRVEMAVEAAARDENVVSAAKLGQWDTALRAALDLIDHDVIEGPAPPEHWFDPAREIIANTARLERLADGRWQAVTARGPLAEPTEHHEIAEATALEHEVARSRDPKITDLPRLHVAGSVDALLAIAARLIRSDAILFPLFERLNPGTPLPSWLRVPLERQIEAHAWFRRGMGARALPILAGRIAELCSQRTALDDARARIAAARRKLAEIEQREREALAAPVTDDELAALADADDEDGVFDLEGA
jgi:hypothetical protein